VTDRHLPVRTGSTAFAPHPDRARRPPDGVLGIAWWFYRWWLVPASLVLGVVLRTREWLFDKSLWLDEITLTIQLDERGFTGLIRPLGGNQGGPLGWLWAEKASIGVFGVHELALRLPAFVASLVALRVFPLVARRLIGPIAAPAATFLVATSPVLIYYAAETKQYSGDTACVLLAILVTTRLLDSPPTRRSAALWGLAAAVLAWFSQPTILVVAACAAVLVLRWLRNRAVLGQLAVGMLVLGVSLASEYLLTLRQLAANQELEAYWQAYGGYPPAHATVLGDLSWAAKAAGRFTQDFAQYAVPALTVALAIWGLATMARLHPWRAAVVLFVLLAAAAAAVTKHYPLAQRLALYLLPLVIVLLCAGLEDASVAAGPRALPRRWRPVTTAVVAVALVVTTLPAVGAGISKLWHPDETTAGRQTLQFVADHQLPSDAVLIDRWGTTITRFYGPRLGVRPTGFVAVQPAGGQPCAANPLVGLSSGRQRAWLVLLHHPSNEPPDRNAVYASQFAARATQLMAYTGPGDTAAYLFDLRMPPVQPVAPLPLWVRNGCLTVS
jgi:hypothetical protein